MEAKIINGNIWKIPVSGTYLDINSADVKEIIGAAAGLAKNILRVASPLSIALAAGVVATFALLSIKQDSEVPWNTLARVRCGYKRGIFNLKEIYKEFKGICLNENIVIQCDGDELTIPINQITYYDYSKILPEKSFFGKIRRPGYVEATVHLIDGAEYQGCLISPQTFDFLTPLGKQKVRAIGHPYYYSIDNVRVSDVEELKTNIQSFLEVKEKKLIEIIGEENFHQFFQRDAS